MGGGPAGLFLAKLLNREHNISVFEEHKFVGYPVHCTGLVSRDVLQYSDKNVILNEIRGAEIHISDESITLEKKGTAAYVINRAEFDRSFYENSDYHILTNERIKEIEKKGKKYMLKSNKEYISDIVIGADGARSMVRNKIVKKNIILLNGIQYAIKNKEYLGEYVQVYLDRKYSEGFFSWIVPREDDILVGLATYDSHPMDRMKSFLKKNIKNPEIIEKMAGQIPIGILPEHNKENIYLTGDAALFVKATSGGGLYYGLKGSQILAECINKGESYKRNLNSMLRELYKDLWLHRIFSKMDDKELLKIILKIKEKDLVNVVNEYGDIDNPSIVSKKLIFNRNLIQFYPIILLNIIKSFLS